MAAEMRRADDRNADGDVGAPRVGKSGAGDCGRAGVAVARGELAGAFVFCGTASDEALAQAGKIPCAVYGFYGGNDARVNATLEKSGAAMKAAGKTFEPVLYDGAGHAFMRQGEEEKPTPANKTAMEQAWARWLKALAANGGG